MLSLSLFYNLLPGHVFSTESYAASGHAFPTVLSYSRMCYMDVSFLQQPVLSLVMSGLQRSMLLLDVSVLVAPCKMDKPYNSLCCPWSYLFCRSLVLHWTRLFFSRLCCLQTCLFYSSLCFSLTRLPVLHLFTGLSSAVCSTTVCGMLEGI